MPGQVALIEDERELLLAYVAQQRDGIKYAAHGLTDDQARLTPTVGSLSIGGLVKHVTAMERTWLDLVRQAGTSDGSDYEDGFVLRPDETLAGALAALDAIAAETEATVRTTDLAAAVPVPKGVPWFPADVEAWSVRWVLLHLVEEIARHAGHADIVRESIDGATMHPLMAAVEGWPATEWLQPWTPAGGVGV
jgi:uncharacterized damage-inducible protein DinB